MSLHLGNEYVVQFGDTLAGIALREGTTIASLRKLNRLTSDSIFPGMILITSKKNTDSVNEFRLRQQQQQQQHRIIIHFIMIMRKHQLNFLDDSSNDSFSSLSDTPVKKKDENGLDVQLFGNFSLSPLISFSTSMYNALLNPISDVYDMTSNSSGTDHIDFPHIIGETNILNNEIIKQIIKQVPISIQYSDWVLLYSLLGNGTDIETFYRRTRGHTCTILIIQTLSGDIFGGFTNHKWKISQSYYGSGESFVFRLNEKNQLDFYKWTGINNFFMWSSDDKIAMGGGGDGFAFVLDNSFITGETCRSATYDNLPLTGQNSSTFTIANIECWGFQTNY